LENCFAAESIEAAQAKKRQRPGRCYLYPVLELKRHLYKDPKKIGRVARVPFTRFPNFDSNAEQMRQLKAELYKVLLPVVQGKKMVELADRLNQSRSQ